MAKASGSTRTSTWRHANSDVQLYYRNGERVEYRDLDERGKKLVRETRDRVAQELYSRLKEIKTEQTIDDNKKIKIGYTKHGLEHFANSAMVILSGKYFSRASMLRINEILENAKYIPSSHELTHARSDMRQLWFTFKDDEGRGVYFKVCWNKQINSYELYSAADKITP